jgi:two-component system LytT family response regulator
MLRILVVDDEPPARERIRDLLAGEDGVEVVGECANGRDAVAGIRALRPDLVFLDVKMPGLDGFGVINALGDGPLPGIIFVTAYDRHALAAFEVEAIDYVLKPILPVRFRQAVNRARKRLPESTVQRDHSVRTVAERLGDPTHAFQIRLGSRTRFVPVDQVDWFEASRNYVKLHVGSDVHVLRDTISRLEAVLDRDAYLRVHRGVIVRRDRIAAIRATRHGEYDVILHDGTEIRSGPTYTDRVRELLRSRQ